jgi:ribosomal protein S28E/S33
MEGDVPSMVEDAPAEVDVVTRRGVDGVEAAHLDEDGLEKGHVATRNVLGPVI